MSNPIIDIHIHIQPLHMFKPEALALMKRGRRDYADVERFSADPLAFLKFLDVLGVERAGVINYVSPDIIGFTPAVNDWCANYCSHAPERLIAFGSVHPNTVPDTGAEVDRLAKLGIRGLKVHPSHQVFSPNAYRDGFGPLAALYERAQGNALPVMIHTGTSIFPGARNVHAQPMLADDVSVDFPELVVILAHGGRPLWMNEAFFLVRRHKNMYMDISGIPPQSLLSYFPRIEEIADKVLWGTDWPGPGVPDIKENIDKFMALPLKEETRRKILYDNAARLFPAKR
ncbi:MAG TPA: amidohydrolase family protein [Candidatus Dormibacteraeota bacterium]|nr:amidohydrolase family protein [Candidatus Dormibacteraeota bacterium]